MGTISSFTGKHSFLSMEYGCEIKMFDATFNSAAALFYSFKTNDIKSRRKYARLSPNKARSKAALVQSDDFDDNKYDYLKIVIHEKFKQNPHLAKLLIDTYPDELVNNITYYDTWMGIQYGKGKNALGKALMEERNDLMKSDK